MVFQTPEVLEEEEKINMARVVVFCFGWGGLFSLCSITVISSPPCHQIFSPSLSSCSHHSRWQVCHLLAWSGQENHMAPPQPPVGRDNEDRLKQDWYPSSRNLPTFQFCWVWMKGVRSSGMVTLGWVYRWMTRWCDFRMGRLELEFDRWIGIEWIMMDRLELGKMDLNW